MPKINTRFLFHGMKPPSPYRVVDTLKMAKRHFRFTSNRLDYISRYLGFTGKMDTGGMELWLGCLDGDKASWDKMLKYNMQDIVILKGVYNKLKPFMTNHPHMHGESLTCPSCSSHRVQCRGYRYTNVGKYQKYTCLDCGRWSSGSKNLLDKQTRDDTLRNIA